MDSDIVNQVENLNVWRRREERAPHKPLLLLYVIARYLQGHDRLVSFGEAEGPLKQLLVDYGPQRQAYHPEYPFSRLQTDGIWELRYSDGPAGRGEGGDISRAQLLAHDAQGGFTEPYYIALKDPTVAARVIGTLLANNFPESYHDDILVALGLDPGFAVTRPRRDPAFRESILRAYEYRCALCGFTARMGQVLVGVEAAHIKWHQAGGPDRYENGVALCSLHHKLFDRGVFTISPQMRVLVSEHANGSAMFAHLVLDFHGRALSRPVRAEYGLREAFLNWHVAEVFRPPARELRTG